MKMFMFDGNEEEVYSLTSIIEVNEDLSQKELQFLLDCKIGEEIVIGMFVLMRTQ